MIRSGESNLVGAGCFERLWRSQQSEASSERGKEIAFARGAKVFEVILLNYLFMISPMSENFLHHEYHQYPVIFIIIFGMVV